MSTTTRRAPPPQAQGENAVIIMHDCVVGGMISGEPLDAATFGRHKIVARKWSVSPPQRYAQHDKSVSVMWTPPRMRTSKYTTIVPDNIRYCTIEQDGKAVDHSRTNIPVDMEWWNKRRAEDLQDWIRRRQG